MGCNCTVGAKLDYLHERYGSGIYRNRDLKYADRIKMFVVNVVVSVCSVIVMPFIFAYVVGNYAFGDGKISLRKFFRLKHNYLKNVGE